LNQGKGDQKKNPFKERKSILVKKEIKRRNLIKKLKGIVKIRKGGEKQS
jgi:hypothetical protein